MKSARAASATDSTEFDLWVPYMSGYGGISVALLPNGATFYIFSDDNEFYWGAAANEANKLAPYCDTSHSL